METDELRCPSARRCASIESKTVLGLIGKIRYLDLKPSS
ncbi:hypothetical protein A7982_13741 [Minicystis rosea]|nr:hypothetical protein A7982_13741 [Minicystis rosea]